MRAIRLIGIIIALGSTSAAAQLAPFTTDGCTFWLDGPPGQPNLWRHCCVAHDLAYWQGGSSAQRLQADQQFKACMHASHSALVANHVYWNVRVGGTPYSPTPYRWGYGWPYWEGNKPRGYRLPSTEEQQQIQQRLPAAQQRLEDDRRLHPPTAQSGVAAQ